MWRSCGRWYGHQDVGDESTILRPGRDGVRQELTIGAKGRHHLALHYSVWARSTPGMRKAQKSPWSLKGYTMRSIEEIFVYGLLPEELAEIEGLRAKARSIVSAADEAEAAIAAATDGRTDLPRRGGWGDPTPPRLTALLRRRAAGLFAAADKAEFASWFSGSTWYAALRIVLDEIGVGGAADSEGMGTATCLPLPGKQQLARERQLRRFAHVAEAWAGQYADRPEGPLLAKACRSLDRQLANRRNPAVAINVLLEDVNNSCLLDFVHEEDTCWVASALRNHLAAAADSGDPVEAAAAVMERWTPHLVLFEQEEEEEGEAV